MTTYVVAILVTAVPDSVMQLQDSKLRVRPDKCSYLLCKYTFSGTQVGKIEPVKTPTSSSSGMLSSASTTTSTSSIDSTIEQILKRARTTTDITSTTIHTDTTTPTDTTTAIQGNDTTTMAATTTPINISTNANTLTNHNLGKRSAELSASTSTHLPAPINTEMTGDAVLLPTVYKMNIVGTLIIHINANKKIHKFEYIQKVVRLVTCKSVC